MSPTQDSDISLAQFSSLRYVLLLSPPCNSPVPCTRAVYGRDWGLGFVVAALTAKGDGRGGTRNKGSTRVSGSVAAAAFWCSRTGWKSQPSRESWCTWSEAVRGLFFAQQHLLPPSMLRPQYHSTHLLHCERGREGTLHRVVYPLLLS